MSVTLQQKSRKELQEICKKNNIRGNLSNKEIAKCVDLIISGKPVPFHYKKVSKFEKNKNYLIFGLAIYGLFVTTLLIMQKYNCY